MATRRHLDDLIRGRMISKVEDLSNETRVVQDFEIGKSAVSPLKVLKPQEETVVKMISPMGLFRGSNGTGFVFMDDNVRSHRTPVLEELLDSEDINRIDRPTYSLDCSPESPRVHG
ncbi:hypothetical protein AVEN_159401-1 [Araneus ventricosus]|uniref:Tc1-like transposase DDE domain-containing protein n=1 Tax=Araneus ventricosus TaxID=182803 RepID=A0A4Y2A324_ARAVE|nr:hypothetical protein AVEN_159401-1 [Araneus ventricosus]